MNETARLQQLAYSEISKHLEEADRLKELALTLLRNAEWNTEQAQQWLDYVGGLAVEQEADYRAI